VKRYRKAPRLGTRVTFKPETLFDISYYRGKRLQPGTCGKVSKIAGPKGKGVYCDPMNRLVAVRWDNGKMLCVPPKTLVQGCDKAMGCTLGVHPRGRAERRAVAKTRGRHKPRHTDPRWYRRQEQGRLLKKKYAAERGCPDPASRRS